MNSFDKNKTNKTNGTMSQDEQVEQLTIRVNTF